MPTMNWFAFPRMGKLFVPCHSRTSVVCHVMKKVFYSSEWRVADMKMKKRRRYGRRECRCLKGYEELEKADKEAERKRRS